MQIINPVEYKGWDNLLLSTPGYSFFHSSAWSRVLVESYGYTPKYFTMMANHKLLALIPVMEINSFLTGRRGVSLPFTDYCKPIIANGIPFQNLFEQIIEHGKHCSWKSLELRSSSDPLPSTLPSLTYLGHVLDLSRSEGEVFANFRDSTKRNVLKAMKEGVEVKINYSLESVNEFYRLNCLTRKEHGLPPQPFHFFQKIYDHVISKGLGMVVLASLDQEMSQARSTSTLAKKQFSNTEPRIRNFNISGQITSSCGKLSSGTLKTGIKVFVLGGRSLKTRASFSSNRAGERPNNPSITTSMILKCVLLSKVLQKSQVFIIRYSGKSPSPSRTK